MLCCPQNHWMYSVCTDTYGCHIVPYHDIDDTVLPFVIRHIVSQTATATATVTETETEMLARQGTECCQLVESFHIEDEEDDVLYCTVSFLFCSVLVHVNHELIAIGYCTVLYCTVLFRC